MRELRLNCLAKVPPPLTGGVGQGELVPNSRACRSEHRHWFTHQTNMKGLFAGCLSKDAKAKPGKTDSGRMLQVVKSNALGGLLVLAQAVRCFPCLPS